MTRLGTHLALARAYRDLGDIEEGGENVSERAPESVDRRHELVRVERLLQEGRSQAEIEAALDTGEGRPSSVVRLLCRVLRVETRKAA
jgi:hypothetical protein